MSNAEEIINKQLAIVKQILSKTGDGTMTIDLQIEVYRQVNKWLISDKIALERKNNNGNHNNNEVKPASQKQLDLLDKLEIEYKPGIDMKTASAKIKSELGG